MSIILDALNKTEKDRGEKNQQEHCCDTDCKTDI